MLEAWVEAGESGPVIVLAGEADMTGAGRIDALITEQLAAGAWRLTIDVSGLRFADAASIRPLALAARTLTERGGRLVVLDPQPSVARVLDLLGVDQLVTIRSQARIPQQPEIGARREAERTPEPGRIRKARDEHGTG
jgi:anti-sigma B factor antagonist